MTGRPDHACRSCSAPAPLVLLEYGSVPLANELIETRALDSRSLVVEIGSNDGYLLQYFAMKGMEVLGIEPARNIAATAEEKGIPTWTRFFGTETAKALVAEHGQVDVLIGNNVLAHVGDLDDVARGVALALKPDGIAVFEFPYVRDMIEQCEFDTVYHEHLCYFSLTSVAHLMDRHGMGLIDVQRIPIHGGSLRVTLARSESTTHGQRVTRFLQQEQELGMTESGFYAVIAQHAQRLRTELQELLGTLSQEGRRIAAYGASAKGSTLMSYCGITAEQIEFVADRSTYKQGYLTPGNHLPIVAPERLLKSQPDYVLLLTWNFADEILAQHAEFRARGGRFIIPVPEVRIT